MPGQRVCSGATRWWCGSATSMAAAIPPQLPDCAGADDSVAGDAPQITSPLRGVTYTLRLSQVTTIALRANRTGQGPLYWFADQGFVARTDGEEGIAWNPPQPGHYVLR